MKSVFSSVLQLPTAAALDGNAPIESAFRPTVASVDWQAPGFVAMNEYRPPSGDFGSCSARYAQAFAGLAGRSGSGGGSCAAAGAASARNGAAAAMRMIFFTQDPSWRGGTPIERASNRGTSAGGRERASPVKRETAAARRAA